MELEASGVEPAVWELIRVAELSEWMVLADYVVVEMTDGVLSLQLHYSSQAVMTVHTVKCYI